MILEVRINNFMVFSNPVQLSMEADMRTKRLDSNVYSSSGFNIVKSACLYGPNNVGKSCMTTAIYVISKIMNDEKAKINTRPDFTNIYTDSNIASLGITFMQDEEVYSFDFKLQVDKEPSKGKFIYECLKKITRSSNGKEQEHLIYIRDYENSIFKFPGEPNVESMMEGLSQDNIVLYLFGEPYIGIQKYKTIFKSFSDTVKVLTLAETMPGMTAVMLKQNDYETRQIVELIKGIDVDIDDYYYKEDESLSLGEKIGSGNTIKINLDSLVAVRNNREYKSIDFDSKGTKEVISLSGYMVDAINNGKTLVVDEIDGGLHFKTTRSIVSMFNNIKNKCGQLICTTQDIALLDTMDLFRKDQIWFLDRSRDKANPNDIGKQYLYRLDDFTAGSDGVRAETNIAERYFKGRLGAVPHPNLSNVFGGEVIDEQ